MSKKSSNQNTAIEWLIEYRRLVFSLVLLLIAVGLAALSSMARQEDPSFPYRAGLVKIFYPGATPLQIERLITEPLEEELAQISEIDKVISTSRDDLAIVNIELFDFVYDTDAAWDRVLRAIDRAQLEFPSGVGEIEFDDRQIDMPAAVLSLTGSDDPILLEQAALILKKRIISLPGISRIEVEGAPEKELIVKLDQEVINRLGVSRQFIARTIASRNQIIPGGLVSSSDKNIRLNTQSDFESIDEIRNTNISLPSGQIVPLNAIAEVTLEPKLPLASQAFQDGRRTVSLGVITERGQVDIVKFGQQLRERIAGVEAEFYPLRIEESFFQPDYVNDRLSGLRSSLFASIAIIAIVVFLAMGWRTGILVSAVLPVVSMISLGLYSVGGGVFHQMAVIGVVISLGILIDNAIVIVEYIKTALRNGVDKGIAIRNAVRIMSKPLMASTGTTIAAFIPLLLAKGGVGDFTRAIPIMIVIALLVSYVISVFVLPMIAFYWLKSTPDAERQNRVVKWTQALATKCADIVEYHPKRVLMLIFAMVAFSLALSPTLKQEFFPSTDRAQIVIDLELPTNTPLAVTAKTSNEIEDRLSAHPAVAAIYRYVGGAGFRFYYNMGGAPNESHVARFTVNTTDGKYNQELVNWVRESLKPDYPDAVLIPRLLGQGPPRPAPIEIRVKHPSMDTLFTASQSVKAVLARTEGVTELRSNLDLGTPELSMSIQDNAALSLGLQPNDVASAVFAESRGLNAGQFLYDSDPVPIRVRSSKGQRTSVDVVRNQYVYDSDQQATPLSQLAAMSTNWKPTSVRHHNFDRTVTVLAQVQKGYAFNQILADFENSMRDVQLEDGVVIEYGGDAAASSEANSNIATGAPLAAGLLLIFMMLQFNSFRRISIVFATIPLAAVGVIPGLAFSGQPFGFQSLLGVIALIGIVLNNAIVLIDVVDQMLERGKNINEAIRAALEQRTAPIILTTATTILGLLPLAISSSTLWPPMAWAIISGLMLSTVLTLVAIPALCKLTLGKKRLSIPAIQANKMVTSTLLLLVGGGFLLGGSPSQASESAPESTESLTLSLNDVYQKIGGNRLISAAMSDQNAAQFDEQALSRRAWFPKLSLAGEYSRRDDGSVIDLPNPIGQLEVSEDSAYVYEVKITQPLFQPALQRYETASARSLSDASESRTEATIHQVTGLALDQYLRVLVLQETRRAQLALLDSLKVRRERIATELQSGRVLKTDLLQIDVEINELRQRLMENRNDITVVSSELAKSLDLDLDTKLELTPVADLYRKLNNQPDLEMSGLSCLNRFDCLALEQELAALASRKKGVKARGLPNINVSFAERRSDGQLFVSDRDQRAMLEFSWDIFSGGQRRSEQKSLQARYDALEQRVKDFQQQIQIEFNRARASWINGESALNLALASVDLSKERLRLSRRRYDNGLLNLDQLLDAEASVSQSSSNLATAKISLIRAWVQQQLATGESFALLFDE